MARTRSPSYPGINLKDAIAKAKTIYDNERQSAALVDTIAAHWGYKAGSGSANVVLAALRKFGLVTYEGTGESRKARLTGSALRIIRDDKPESPERDELIRKAGLAPKIHEELWERKKEGASDVTLLDFLKFERGFSDTAAPDLVDEFNRTIAYAKLSETDSVTDNDIDTDTDEDLDLSEEEFEGGGGTGTLRRKPRTYRLPMTADEDAILQLPPNVTEFGWDQMLAYLNVMKKSILKDTNEE